MVNKIEKIEPGVWRLDDGRIYVDIQPGGREGRRAREIFLSKKHALTFKRRSLLDQEQRSVSMGSTLSIVELINRFENEYARLRFRGFPDEKYRIKVIRDYFAAENKAIMNIRLIDGMSFINHRISEGKRIGTINRDMNTLKRIFTWAVENDYLPYSPFDKKLKHLKGAESRIRWLTESEARVLLSTARTISADLERFIFMGLETGLRFSNLRRLEGSHIGDEFVTALRTKSGKPYDVPISLLLNARINEFKGRQGYVLNTSNIKRLFRRAVEMAGLSTREDDPQKVTVHTLRHTFASRWLQRGVPIYTVSKWLGHSSIKMTESVYGHLSKAHHVEQMREAERRQTVDTSIVAFPQNASESNGPNGIRTRDLCLEREDPCL